MKLHLPKWRALGCSLGLSLALSACSSLPIDMPAITDADTQTHLPGKIIWHDLISDTPETSQTFYSELLGWQFETVPLNAELNYRLIRHQGRLIGGMVDQTQLQVKDDISQWIPLMSVTDINRAVQR